MPITKNKKHQIKQVLYKEVVNKLERCFNDLSVSFMPINGTYLFYAGKADWVGSSKLFSNIEIVVEKKNFIKLNDYLNRINIAVKTADIKHKSVYTFSIDGFDVIRVDIYNAVNFPNNFKMSAEELFNRGIKREKYNLLFPSCEDVLLLLFCKSFHFIDQFLDYTLFNAIRFITSSSGFSWKKFWSLAQKNKIEKCSLFLLKLYKKNTKEQVPYLKASFYPWLLANNFFHVFYKVYPRFIKKIIYKVFLADKPLKYLYEHLVFNVTRFINKVWDSIYKALISRIAKKYVIENENTVFNAFSKSAKKRLSEFQLDYSFNEEFIMGTSSGLWYLRGEKLFQMTYGASYGITFDGERWYANQNFGQYSRIISFEIDRESDRPKIMDMRNYILGLPRNVHQIDYCDNLLYVVDTQNNRIITVDKRGKKKYYFPNRKIKSKKNNNHFNSVFLTDKYVYICAHNGTLKPKGYSEVYVLNKRNMKKHEIIETDANCAHNVLLKDGKILYCDSMVGALICDMEAVFKDSRFFMRGMAFSDNYLLVGGSQFASREERETTDSVIYILDKGFEHLKTIELESIGQFYEIRGVNNDCGLSINGTDYS